MANKKQEYLTQLRQLEIKMSSAEVIGFVQQQKPEYISKFFDIKSEVAIMRSRLERSIIDTIASRLEGLEDEFKKGIKNVDNELEKLKSANELLNSINLLVGVIARIFI